VVSLESVWPHTKGTGLDVVWSSTEQAVRTAGGYGGHYAIAGGPSVKLHRRVRLPMVPAAVLAVHEARISNRGGVSSHSSGELRGDALSASIDIEHLRHYPTRCEAPGQLDAAVLLAQPGDQVFGHQLLDVLPRLLTARDLFGTRFPYLISAVSLSSFGQLLGDLGLADVELVPLPEEEEVATLATTLYVVTGARQGNRFDPERIRATADLLSIEGAASTGRSVFLSRRRQGGHRQLLNREQVEEFFAEQDYHVIEPEVVGARRTAELIEGAESLAGEDGSALHNVLARPKGLICLGHGMSPDNIHLHLCDALGVAYRYFGGNPSEAAEEADLHPRNRSWNLAVPWLRERMLEQRADDASTRLEWHTTDCFWGAEDPPGFRRSLEDLVGKHFPRGTSLYAGDNLITIGRNISPLSDVPFLDAAGSIITSDNDVGQGILWRLAMHSWAARSCLTLEGDFVECGEGTASAAKIMCDYVRFADVPKRLFLYGSTFSDADADGAARRDALSARFAGYPNVRIQGDWPQPAADHDELARIAFLHIDLGDPADEILCLDALFDLVVPGGLVLLNAYGASGGRAQKMAEDPWFAARGYSVLEMPSGQGLVIKR
jgi:O-methyltransferase